MKKIMIIFIDSLPFNQVRKMKYLNSLKPVKVTPGFGYSINILPLMLGGYKADDLGYLNEWNFDKNSRFIRYNWGFKLLNIFNFNFYIDRAIHKIISKITNVANIPFNLIQYFSYKPDNSYKGKFSKETVLSKNNFHKVLYDKYKKDKDLNVYLEAKEAIGSHDKIFLSLVDLDHLGHIKGVGSLEYNIKLRKLDEQIKDLADKFKKNGGEVIVLSDHGMVNVNKGVKIDIEKEIGKVDEDSYVYFIDSTLLRVWTFSKEYKKKVEDYLKTKRFGKILSDKEREKYGITSKKFGDFIFILNEGICFSPNFFGRGLPKAMHGYLPGLESQKSFIAFSGDKKKLSKIKECKDVWKFLESGVR